MGASTTEAMFDVAPRDRPSPFVLAPLAPLVGSHPAAPLRRRSARRSARRTWPPLPHPVPTAGRRSRCFYSPLTTVGLTGAEPHHAVSCPRPVRSLQCDGVTHPYPPPGSASSPVHND